MRTHSPQGQGGLFARLSPHYRSTLRLGFPIVVAQTGHIALGFIDSAMIGHYGVDELAASAFCISLFNLPIVLMIGYSLGLVPLMGQRFGRGESVGAGAIFRTGLWSNLRFALLLTAAMLALYFRLDHLGQPPRLIPLIRPYFLLNLIGLPFVCLFSCLKLVTDTAGRTSTAMWIMLMGNALNVVGNYLMIYGHLGLPEWGLFGAGMATLISRVFMPLALLLVLLRAKSLGRVRLGFFRHRLPGAEARREVFTKSSRISLQLGLEQGMFTASIFLMGWLGNIALAAHQVTITAQSIGFMTYYGLGSAASIRVSHFWGKGQYRNAKRAANAGFHTVLASSAVLALIMITCRHPLAALFTDSPEVIALAETLILCAIAYQPPDALQISYANALRGAGQTNSLALVALIGYFAVGIPLSYLLAFPLGLGPLGVWAAFPVGLGLAGIGYYIRFSRLVDQQLGTPRQAPPSE
ncbi:MAG: MATE family efflux transporter [Bacteroidia bacterium]|nr:MAG: MATE family efflux transporter [Bacteroidia bacterium]